MNRQDYEEISGQLATIRKELKEFQKLSKEVAAQHMAATRLSLGLPDNSLQPDPRGDYWDLDPFLGKILNQEKWQQWLQDQAERQRLLELAKQEPPPLEDAQAVDSRVHAKAAAVDPLAGPASNVGRYWQPSTFDPFTGDKIQDKGGSTDG